MKFQSVKRNPDIINVNGCSLTNIWYTRD